MLEQDPHSRVACETMVTTGQVVVAGEITSSASVDIQQIVRDTIADIGYEDPEYGFDYRSCGVLVALDQQSPDISQGVSEGEGLHAEQGAGDQGMMFGYACSENDSLMPSAIYYSHKITKALSTARHGGQDWMGPDGKAQVTVEYRNVNEPVRISNIICSTQHSEDLKDNPGEVQKRVEEIIKPELNDMFDNNTIFQVNPTGNFVTGGPDGDTGVTGRKIIVDTYGGYAPHGGGAFSGKDCTKVDRSGAYMARYLAKNIVASGVSQNATIQLSYAIGVKEPVSLYVYCDGKVRNDICLLYTSDAADE